MTSADTPTRAFVDTLVNLVEQALTTLETAMKVPPQELKEDVDVVERQVVQLRDALIDRLREDPNNHEATRWRRVRNQANVALSLICGVEYPAIGVQRKPLEQVLTILRELMPQVRRSGGGDGARPRR